MQANIVAGWVRSGTNTGKIQRRLQILYFDPQWFLTGSHKACFTNVGVGRYHIHLSEFRRFRQRYYGCGATALSRFKTGENGKDERIDFKG